MNALPPIFDFASSPIPAGLTVIEASAGTGKTYAISHLVPRLLLEGQVNRIGELLLVTFTRDAARELAERVRRVLVGITAAPARDAPPEDSGLPALRQLLHQGGEPARQRLERALVDIDQLGVSTIHAFCQRVLSEEGVLCGRPAPFEVRTDDADLLEQALRDLRSVEIERDALLASLVQAQRWDSSQDADFILSTRHLEAPEFVPPPLPWADALERLHARFQRLAEDAGSPSLRAILGRVPNWNKGYNANKVAGLLDALASACGPSPDPRCWAALKLGAELDKLVNSRSKAGKELALELRLHPWVVMAAELQAFAGGSSSALRWSWLVHARQSVADTVELEISRSGQITQDGLVVSLVRALRHPLRGLVLSERLAQRYRVALIDESQDTDPRQFEIFRRIFLSRPEHRLLMIGDPKQAIYGFRGADLETYLAARQQADANYTLLRTYRSPQPLVVAVNALFSREQVFGRDDLTFPPAQSGLAADIHLAEPGQPPVRIEAWSVDAKVDRRWSTKGRARQSAAEAVSTEIVRLLRSGAHLAGRESPALRPGDFAVLVSDHRLAAHFSEALLARGLPVVRKSREDVFSSDEAEEVLLLLRALQSPRSARWRRAAAFTRLVGTDSAGTPGDPQVEEDAFAASFALWKSVCERRGFAALLEEVDRTCGTSLRLARLPDGERRLTNLRHLSDLLEERSRDRSAGLGPMIRWFAQERLRAHESAAPEERLLQLERDGEAVQIITQHAAKGLEYPLVFCPSLDEQQEVKGWVPLRTREYPAGLVVHLGLREDNPRAVEAQEAARAAVLGERIRLAYVAVTRAKAKVWLLLGLAKANSPSPTAIGQILGGQSATDSFQALQARHPELLHQRAPPAPQPLAWNGASQEQNPPEDALPRPAVPAASGIHSFTSLTRQAHDEAVPVASPTPRQAPSTAATGESFLHFPAGALAGKCLHGWLELWDFGSPDGAAVASWLDKYGLAVRPGASEAVCGMLCALRRARLPGLGATVAQVCTGRGAAEWSFHLPLRPGVSSADIAGALARSSLPWLRDYAERVAALETGRLDGFLHGYLDRVLRWEGRWGVIDWKSNRLGPEAEDYTTEALRECATQSHYLLQMLLYQIALRRHLRSARQDASGVAGAWLVFLRAVRPEEEAGMLHLPAEPAVLDALEALLRPTEA